MEHTIMSRYRQTMRETLELVRQQDFTEGHSDKDFKPYPDWKKTSGGRYPRFKHSQKGEIQIDRMVSGYTLTKVVKL